MIYLVELPLRQSTCAFLLDFLDFLGVWGWKGDKMWVLTADKWVLGLHELGQNEKTDVVMAHFYYHSADLGTLIEGDLQEAVI